MAPYWSHHILEKKENIGVIPTLYIENHFYMIYLLCQNFLNEIAVFAFSRWKVAGKLDY